MTRTTSDSEFWRAMGNFNDYASMKGLLLLRKEEI